MTYSIIGRDGESGELGRRLIQALAAGQEAGGEIRGLQSAAVMVWAEKGGYGGSSGKPVDIQVYDHDSPIDELDRCYDLHRLSYFESREEDLVAIDSELISELRGLLQSQGFDTGSSDHWESTDIQSLKQFMGEENYDNRLRDDTRIDQEVLASLRERYGQG